jgi:hypothetical protein
MNLMARFAAVGAGACAVFGCGGADPGIIGQQLPLVRVFNGVDNQSTISVGFTDPYGNALGTSKPIAYAGTTAQDMIIPNTPATPSINSGGSTLFNGAASLYRINTQYSLYAGGVPGSYVAIPLNDVGGQGNTAGSMDVRAVQIGANTPAIDVFIVPANPGGISGSALFTSLTFGQVTAAPNAATPVDGNGYTTLAASSGTLYEVLVTAHNGKAPLATTTSLLDPTVFYTVVVYDSGKGTGVKILSDRH